MWKGMRNQTKKNENTEALYVSHESDGFQSSLTYEAYLVVFKVKKKKAICYANGVSRGVCVILYNNNCTSTTAEIDVDGTQHGGCHI